MPGIREVHADRTKRLPTTQTHYLAAARKYTLLFRLYVWSHFMLVVSSPDRELSNLTQHLMNLASLKSLLQSWCLTESS